MRGTPLDHSCGRVAKLAPERRRVQQRCPRAPTPEPGKGRRPKNRRVAKLALKRRRVQQRCPRAPTPEPGKGRRPKNRRVAKLALKRRRVQQRCPRAPTPEPGKGRPASCQAGTQKAEGSAALPSAPTPEPGKGRRPKNRRVAKLALKRRRVQQRCPRAPTPEPGKGRRPKNRRVAKLALKRRRVQQRCPRAPTPEPGKGRRPKNRQSQRRKVFLPGCSVFSLSWSACAGAFLVPGRWFSGPAPSGSCLFLFRLMFLSTGRGRHVPAPSGRDVGSSAGAPTQEPALSRYLPFRTMF